MLNRRALGSFACALVIFYGILIIPWPHFNQLYGRYLQTIGNACFEKKSDQRVIRFEASHDPLLDTNIVLADPATADLAGNMRARILAFDSRGIGWIPTALTLALILATPLPLHRRITSALLGIVAVHAFIAFTLWVYVENESLQFFSPARESHSIILSQVGDALEAALVTQLGAGIIAAVLIWLSVSFRRTDWQNVLSPLQLAKKDELG